MMCP